jgi:protein phosphatase
MTEAATADKSAVSTPRLVVQAVLRTDVGLVRSENQDFGTYTTPQEEAGSHGGRLLIVADGMGGHRGGATASRLAGETVKKQYLGAETEDIPTALRDSLTRANARIFSESQSNPDLRGMGTTTSALAVRNNQAWFGHVGDSRIYLIHGGEIKQLTEDHSLVASMVREGLLSPSEAENHPRRNVLQRSMGVSEEVEIDVRGPYDLQEGDVFILCSDGLHGVVKEPELLQIGAMPIRRAADEFVKRVLERGAPDNVTVIVAKVVREDAVDETLIAGDDTLVDAPYDETQRDTAPIPTIPEEGAGGSAAEGGGGATPSGADVGGDARVAPPPPAALPPAPDDAATPPKPRSLFKWLFILVVVLGAAGALIYAAR